MVLLINSLDDWVINKEDLSMDLQQKLTMISSSKDGKRKTKFVWMWCDKKTGSPVSSPFVHIDFWPKIQRGEGYGIS